MKDKKDRITGEEDVRGATHGSEPIDSCGLCTSLFTKEEPAKGSKGWRFMTEREFTVLKAMRGLRERAVKIKKRIRGIKEDLRDRPGRGREKVVEGAADEDVLLERAWEQQMAEELLDHCARLATLKDQWGEMDLERMEAQEERMRQLGHIQ